MIFRLAYTTLLVSLISACTNTDMVLVKSSQDSDLSEFTVEELCSAKRQVESNPFSRNDLLVPNILREIEVRNVFSKREREAIKEEKVFIGMNKVAAKCSWGTPSNINTTISKYSRSEQWVYNYSYLYIEDGVVGYIQN